MKLLWYRLSMLFYKISRNVLLLWKFLLLFSKWWKWLNFLLILLVTPMDFKNIFEMFLLDEDETDHKETESTTSRKLENIFYITVLIFTFAVIYYTFFTGGGEGIDLSSLRRSIPSDVEVPKISINDDGEFFVSLLDEKIDVDPRTQSASGTDSIESKHW